MKGIVVTCLKGEPKEAASFFFSPDGSKEQAQASIDKAGGDNEEVIAFFPLEAFVFGLPDESEGALHAIGSLASVGQDDDSICRALEGIFGAIWRAGLNCPLTPR